MRTISSRNIYHVCHSKTAGKGYLGIKSSHSISSRTCISVNETMHVVE